MPLLTLRTCRTMAILGMQRVAVPSSPQHVTIVKLASTLLHAAFTFLICECSPNRPPPCRSDWFLSHYHFSLALTLDRLELFRG